MKKTTLFVGLLGALITGCNTATEPALTVFAAASLTDVMEELGAAYTRQTRAPVRFSFAASSTLARQIESGAPASVFVSADEEWMDYLASRGLIQPASRTDVTGNTLVLIAPADSTTQLDIAPGFTLLPALGQQGRIATGDPDSVPAGKYARSALEKLGAWNSVAGRMIPADNVRTALKYVALGEAPLGIVYATDARGEAGVRVVGTFPAGTHDPIRYPAAVTSRGGTQAASFVTFLASEPARAIFARYGFSAP